MSLGFFVPAACSCLMAAIGVQMRGAMPAPADPTVFNYLEVGMFAAWFLLLGALVVYLGVKALRTGDPIVRRHIGFTRSCSSWPLRQGRSSPGSRLRKRASAPSS